jgi:hypothetical protein
MPHHVTNEDLLMRCQTATHEAAHIVGLVGGQPSLETVTSLRNKLRAAHSAAQELKTRMKKAKQNE